LHPAAAAEGAGAPAGPPVRGGAELRSAGDGGAERQWRRGGRHRRALGARPAEAGPRRHPGPARFPRPTRAAGFHAPMTDRRRELPAVERLLGEPSLTALLARVGRPAVLAAARTVLARARASGSPPADGWPAAVDREVAASVRPALPAVLNATGVVIHTNLGRAPLAGEAVAAMVEAARGYAALEYDLEGASRGERGAGVRRLLAELAGAEDALVVNNAAGALVLALNTLAAGREVLLSRGELVEI